MRKVFLAAAFTLVLCNLAYAANFTGAYTLNSGGTTLTLTLKQDAHGGITGSLSNNAGTSFKLVGKIEDDAVVGRFDNGVHCQARLKGDQLIVVLADAEQDGQPDFNASKQLIFIRQGQGQGEDEPAAPPPSKTPGKASSKQKKSQPSHQEAAAESPSAPAKLSGEEIGDPSWGFKFRAPQGWTAQKNESGAALRHSSVTGVILVIPHQRANMNELQADMQKGITEEQVQLRSDGQLKHFGKNAIGGNYSGTYQGQPVKARGIATLSPNGGGAIIIGLALSDQFSPQLAAAADAIASGMSYTKMDAGGQGDGNMMQYFAGTWSLISAKTTRRFTLSANGTFSEYSESSYSGQFSNQYGDNTGSWGTGSQNQKRGRWTIQGNRERGTMTITYENGETSNCPYRVHVEKGKTYWREYYICDVLYGR